jgi:hypothetical protein
VGPAAADAAASTFSTGNRTEIESAADTTLPLQAFLRDAYGNDVLDAADVAVRVDGFEIADEQPLVGPSYFHTVTIPKDFDGTLTISFSLDDVQIGSPVEITVAPRPPKVSDPTGAYIAAGVSSFLLLAGAFFFRHRLQSAAQKLELAAHEMEGQLQRFSMQKREMEELEDEVRLKKHSEEELKVMVSALEAVSKERQDELKEVMLESSDLKVERLLGKGG